MSKIDDILRIIENAEYEYNKRCKAKCDPKGYRYSRFRTMMIAYTSAALILWALVIIWVL